MNGSRRQSVVAALLLWLIPAPLIAATTAFTYQGQLKDAGAPAEGRYDLAFSLWSDPTSADTHYQIGGTLEFLGHPVSDGLFEVQLDFRDGAFPGDPRYLQIDVRPTGAHVYTTLSPRQEVTPTPYAMTAQQTIGVDGYSLDAADGSQRDVVYVDDRGNVGVGTQAPRAALDVAGTVASTGLKLTTAPSDGFVLTSDEYGNAAWAAPPSGGSGFWQNGPEDHIFFNDGYVGIGTGSTQTPAQMLHVEGGAYVRDRVGIGVLGPGMPLDVRGDARVFNGSLHIGAEGFDPYIELMSNENSDALEMRLKSLDGVGFAVTNSTDAALMVVESSSGNVGIGTTAPEHKLHAVGGTGTAIFGVSNAFGVASVMGNSIHSGGRGVAGEVTSSGGYGVYGKAVDGAGVHGVVTSADGGNGVEGYAESATGHAVYGFNEADHGDAIGVYGESGSPDGYGGYFTEKVYVSGDAEAGAYKYHAPKERRLSIPGCALLPHGSSTEHYQRTSGRMMGTDIPTTGVTITFYAPVYLPDGANVTQLTAYAFVHAEEYPFMVSLYKRPFTDPGAAAVEIVSMTSLGSGNVTFYEDVSEVIDMSTSAYFLRVEHDMFNIFTFIDTIVITYTVDEAD